MVGDKRLPREDGGPMTRKTVASMRFDEASRKALAELSSEWGQSEAEIVRRLVPTGPWLLALKGVPHDKGADLGGVVRGLMADGLRRLMAISANGIKPEYLDVIADPEAIAELYVEWLDGLSTLIGVVGPLGGQFKLVEGEAGFLPERNPAWIAARVHNQLMAAVEALRSPHIEVRADAGARLSRSVELGPDRAALLGRAIGGDATAVDALAADLAGEEGGDHV